MDEFHENLKIAEGIKGEILWIEKIQKEIDKVSKEINELQEKEKLIKSHPDRIEAYKKRLAKLQEEIEKQNAITKKIETPEDIAKLAKVVSQRQMAIKTLEYFSTLHTEKKIVLSIDQVKIKVNYIRISLVYNELLHAVQTFLPSHVNIHVKTISKLVSDYILLYSSAISVVSSGTLFIITYAVSRKSELTEKEIQKRIVEELIKDSKDSVESIIDRKLYENISKLAVYEDILIEVKARIQTDLLKISLKQLNRYNREVFYGTVYHIENIDLWMCDNLVNKLDGPHEKIQITHSEQRELFSISTEECRTVIDLLAGSMQKQKIVKVSRGFYRIIKALRQIGYTQRSRKEKIQTLIIDKILKYFKKQPAHKSLEGIRNTSLRLTDSQAMLGMIMIVKSESTRENEFSHMARIFEDVEENFFDIVEEAFADMLLCSDVENINFLERNVEDKIDRINSNFIEVVTDIFSKSFLVHIKASFYNRILTNLYHTVESNLEDLSVQEWKDVLYLVLKIAEEYKNMCDFYANVESVYKIISFDGSATEFLQKCSEDEFSLPSDLIQELIAYSFKDPRLAYNIVKNLKKQEKKE